MQWDADIHHNFTVFLFIYFYIFTLLTQPALYLNFFLLTWQKKGAWSRAEVYTIKELSDYGVTSGAQFSATIMHLLSNYYDLHCTTAKESSDSTDS